MNNIIHLLLFFLITASCGNKLSVRQIINQSDNGYIQVLQSTTFEVVVQYHPPAYLAEKEKKIFQSTESNQKLTEAYNEMQQFLVKYRQLDNSISLPTPEPGQFYLITSDTIPCIDLHVLAEVPGNPYREALAVFPVTQESLGNNFQLLLHNFPLPEQHHILLFNLNK